MKAILYRSYETKKENVIRELLSIDSKSVGLISVLNDSEIYDFDKNQFNLYPASRDRKYTHEFPCLIKSKTKTFESVEDAKSKGYELSVSEGSPFYFDGVNVIITAKKCELKEGWNEERVKEFISEMWKNSCPFSSEAYLTQVD